MLSKIRLAAVATAALLAASSMAQADPNHFAGLYAGGHFGHIEADADIVGFGGGSLGGGSSIVGLQIGYNFVDGNFLWGIETDISLTSAGGSRSPCPYDGRLSCVFDTGIMSTLRPRVGYAVDDWLFFLTGGIGASRFTVKSHDEGGTQVDDFHGGIVTWTVGGGVEYMVGDIAGVRVEYRYTKFFDFGFHPFLSKGGVEVDVESHAIMGGVNFYF